jgi:hypothetical protein
MWNWKRGKIDAREVCVNLKKETTLSGVQGGLLGYIQARISKMLVDEVLVMPCMFL